VKLRWTARAVADLEEIADYLLGVQPKAWDKLLARIELTLDYLLQFPHMGKMGVVKGTREFVISGTPYIVVFRIKLDVVQILSIRDGRMRVPPSYEE
jgi:toxin ParE1/3/4